VLCCATVRRQQQREAFSHHDFVRFQGLSSPPPSLAGEIFCILVLFKNIFYKKTYAKTFAENRPFLGVLEHDAKV